MPKSKNDLSWLLSLLGMQKGDGRWTVMRRLAKEDEKAGNTNRAKGWRWLAENQRWPTKSGFNAASGQYRGPYHWIDRDYKWYDSPYFLPEEVLDFVTLKSSKYVAKLLAATAEGVGRWLSGELVLYYNEVRKLLEKQRHGPVRIGRLIDEGTIPRYRTGWRRFVWDQVMIGPHLPVDWESRIRQQREENRKRMEEAEREFSTWFDGWLNPGGLIERKKALDTFGLSWPFSAEELQQARRKLALENHPDRGGDHEKMVEINLAYEQLMKLTDEA